MVSSGAQSNVPGYTTRARRRTSAICDPVAAVGKPGAVLERVLGGNATDRWSAALPLTLAALVLGWGLQQSNGMLSAPAFLALNVALALSLLALANPRVDRLELCGDVPVRVLAAIGMALQIAMHLTALPGAETFRFGRVDLTPYHAGMVAVSALSALVLLAPLRFVKTIVIPAFLVVYVLLGSWVLFTSPRPHIDVAVWHPLAFERFLAGGNPYAMTMPNIYGQVGQVRLYAPGFADATRVAVGFPYPPLSFGMSLLGYLTVGDYRYANLAALALAGALMAYARPHRLGPVLALIFLFTPRGFFVLEQGWIEPNAILLLALTVFVACRAPRLTWMGLGLLLAVKQYLVLLVPISIFLLPRDRTASWRDAGKLVAAAFALAAALTVPFFLWDPQSFLRSTVVVHALAPFRSDALSYVAWSARNGQPVLPLWLCFLTVPVVWALAFWRAPRTPAGFATTAAVLIGMFFAFAKQAFANYSFFVIAASCLAAAAVAPPEPSSRWDP